MSLNIKGLSKSFGERQVLNKIDLSIQEGSIIFILGRSGTGKSVLLKNIVGLMRPEEGEIWLDGEEISKFSEEQYFTVRRKCGMVFQQPALFDSLSIYENVAFGLRRHFSDITEDEVSLRVKRFLQLVNLAGIENRRPSEISYGMQKRVSLARAVAIEPRYVLFDEPTTGLDPVTTNAVNQLISRLSRTLNTTSIVVSHDMHCALDIADQIVVLDQGRVLANSTPQALWHSSDPLVREFLAEVQRERPV